MPGGFVSQGQKFFRKVKYIQPATSGGNNQDTAEQFQSQEEIKELFQQVNKREENPSLMYKIDKKFDNKLYRCVRKADKADFVMKSVPQA